MRDSRVFELQKTELRQPWSPELRIQRIRIVNSAWVSKPTGPRFKDALSSYNHFPQMIPREKEFHRVEFLEQLFEAPVIEVLCGFALPSWGQGQNFRLHNTVGIKRDC